MRTVDLDGGPRAPDRPAEAEVQPGHEPVARPGPEVRGEVEAAADRDRHDAGEHHEELLRLAGDRRQDPERDVGRRPDEHDVDDRPDARPLAERVPGEQDRDAQQDAHGAELEPGELRDALVERLPRPEAHARLGHERDPDAEHDQPDDEPGEPRQHDARRPAGCGRGGPGGRGGRCGDWAGAGHPVDGTGRFSRRPDPRARRRSASADGGRPRTSRSTSRDGALPPEPVDVLADPRVPARVAVEPVAARRADRRPEVRREHRADRVVGHVARAPRRAARASPTTTTPGGARSRARSR